MTTSKISEIRENPSNPRTISKDKFKKLVQSIKDFPEMLQARPIVVDPTNTILGGNMRYKACVEAGLDEVPVYVATWEEAKNPRFIIQDNASYGEWDYDALANDWDATDLNEWGLDLWQEEEEAEGLTDPDEVPEAPEEPKTKPGDLWILGDHRLLCGDSTKADDVERLMGGNCPELMVTDPPYGVNYDVNWRSEAMPEKNDKTRWTDGQGKAIGKVKNDDRADWTEAYSLWSGKVAYVWHDGKASPLVGRNLESCGLVLRNLIIWGKNQHAISRGNYHHKHEPCWYAVRKGESAGWIGDRSQTTLWDIDKPRKSETGHSTQKPIECMETPLKNHEGDVYDPFLGSGTTLIAAEKTGRKCYGMELDPKYCDVIVKRWEDFTGKKAHLYDEEQEFEIITQAQ
jgi:DNA modification methylase